MPENEESKGSEDMNNTKLDPKAQKRADEWVDKTLEDVIWDKGESAHKRKRIDKDDLRQRWTPKQFAAFIIKYAPVEFKSSPIRIKHIFKLKTSVPTIAKLMNSPEFDEEITKYMEKISDKDNLGKLFYMYTMQLIQKTYDTPSVKVAEFVGGVSGQYMPTTKSMNVTHTLTPEQKESLNKVASKALEKLVADQNHKADENDKT